MNVAAACSRDWYLYLEEGTCCPLVVTERAILSFCYLSFDKPNKQVIDFVKQICPRDFASSVFVVRPIRLL